jgi:hypothetical protein
MVFNDEDWKFRHVSVARIRAQLHVKASDCNAAITNWAADSMSAQNLAHNQVA